MLLRLTTVATTAFLVWVPVAQAWSWPVQGPVLQKFAYDEGHPYATGQHRGIDIGAAGAGDPVVAPASGTVSFAGTVPTSGKCVTIETADGYAVTLTHLGSVAVTKGAAVTEGAVVGAVGASGTPDFAVPYVHLGIRLSADANGYLDPLGLLPALAAPPPPDSGGTSSSDSTGVPAGSGDGSAGSTVDPTTTTSSEAAPVAAQPKAARGGSGIVIRDQAPAAAAARFATSARRTTADTAPAARDAKRPAQKTRRTAESGEQPRPVRKPALVEPQAAPAELAQTAVSSRSHRSPAPAPTPAALSHALAAGPGVLAAIAALATAVVGGRRRRTIPPARVVRFPGQRELRRAA